MKTNTNTATKSAAMLVEELNAIRNTATGDDIAAKVAAIQEQVNKENAAATAERAVELVTMTDRVEMFREFINNPTVPSVRFFHDKKSGEYRLISGKKQLSFTKLEAAFQRLNGTKHEDGSVTPDKSATLTRSKRYAAMLSYFVDNLTRSIAGDLSHKPKAVHVPALTYGTEDERKELDFSKNTPGALEFQLNAIVKAILPEGLTITMNKTDVRALKQAATKEKLMEFTMNTEAAFLLKIFSAMKVRMNDAAYVLNSKAKAHKVKEDKPADPKAEAAEDAEREDAAADETFTADEGAEPKKPTDKKQGKKSGK